MDFEARKQKALAIMASRKMWKSNYAPLLIRLLWRLGIKIPPLPLAPLWQVFVVMAVSLSVGSGLWMYWTVWWAQEGVNPLFACEISLIGFDTPNVSIRRIFHYCTSNPCTRFAFTTVTAGICSASINP